MSYATVRWHWLGHALEATWRNGRITDSMASASTKILLEEWDQAARGGDVSGYAQQGPRRNHLVTIPSFLGLVRQYADEVVSVETDYEPPAEDQADKQAIH